MQGLRNLLRRSTVLGCATLWLSLTDCSGGAFKGEAQTSGGSGNHAGSGGMTAGTSDSAAGVAGTDEQGGSPAELGGSGGSGGTASEGCTCARGQYCREASNDCLSCASLGRLHFTTPERIATLSDSAQGARFPRIGSTSTDLVYRFDGVGLRYTSDASTSPGTSLSATDPSDSAPLLLDSAILGLPQGLSLVFDRALPGAPRAIYFAGWSSAVESPELAPEPFNSGLGDYSMALALHPNNENPARAFWMSARNVSLDDPAPQLLTAELAADAPAEAVTLKLGQADCEIADSADPDVDPDLTPWVTIDGRLLLFSTTRLDSSCAVAKQKKDLHSVLLRPDTGQPLDAGAATPLMDVNSPFDDTDPSFSADLCDLYFASNRDGKFAIYRAHRR